VYQCLDQQTNTYNALLVHCYANQITTMHNKHDFRKATVPYLNDILVPELSYHYSFTEPYNQTKNKEIKKAYY